MSAFASRPEHRSYDVVIIGGAIMGSATAWFLTELPDFDGRVLVIERDPTYRTSSTALTNSCIRQQFSSSLNVKISQFTAAFIKTLPERIGDARVPRLGIQSFGYLYLADTPDFADRLRAVQAVQLSAGAATELLSPAQIGQRYPFYALDDIVLGSINLRDEGYWDGGTVFDWLRRSARTHGVEYVHGEVVAMTRDLSGSRVDSVTLGDGTVISAGQVVNASGPRAARTAAMAGIDIPVEPRKRYTWIFTAERPLDRELPLTIDPSGVHFRQDGPQTYLAGGHGAEDPAVAFEDFAMDHGLWQDHVWPVIAARIPQFESIRVINEWAGHYAMNTLDHNAIVGPHSRVTNFHFINGFSGHGLQQAPAMGRGLAEMLVFGDFRSLDLSPLGYGRIERGEPFGESAII